MTTSSAIWATLESLIILSAPIYLLIRKLNKFDKRLDRIEYQLYNNGGESMKDAVDRIETELLVLKTQLTKPARKKIKDE
jgi:hypothetical protein